MCRRDVVRRALFMLDSSPWLDEHIDLKRRMARLPLRNVEMPRSRRSLLLLGIISVSEHRRDLLRCTWAQMLAPLPLRMRFVLGRNASDRQHTDVILTPVEERLLVASSNRAKTRRASGATYSSLSSFLKMHHFFQYAASAPEPLVAIGDDDVFIQPSMLLAQYAQLRMLARMHQLHACIERTQPWLTIEVALGSFRAFLAVPFCFMRS